MLVNLTRAELIVIGSASSAIEPVLEDFERRLSKYVRLSVRELKATPLQQGRAAVLAAEAARLHDALDAAAGGAPAGEGTLVAACDSRGEQLTSEQLASRLLAPRQLVLLVGGAFGLPDDVLARAQLTIAFGRITLPHQLARVVLVEQLYRSFRIARGEPYHH